MQDITNKGLENSWRIGQPERHNQVFKVSQMSVKSRLPLVPLPYSHQTVCIAEVQFREDGGLVKGVEGRVNER